MDVVGCYFLDQLQRGLWLRTKDGSHFLLKDRERDVFLKLYALLDDRFWTHQEVAMYWQVSRERIRQLEVKAFRKLSYRKRQTDSPMGRVYAVLTNNHSLPLDDKERLACHFHYFREMHLPEWDEARFFRFVELFLGISELSDTWKFVKKTALLPYLKPVFFRYLASKMNSPLPDIEYLKKMQQDFLKLPNVRRIKN